jgi:hypothetical protein
MAFPAPTGRLRGWGWDSICAERAPIAPAGAPGTLPHGEIDPTSARSGGVFTITSCRGYAPERFALSERSRECGRATAGAMDCPTPGREDDFLRRKSFRHAGHLLLQWPERSSRPSGPISAALAPCRRKRSPDFRISIAARRRGRWPRRSLSVAGSRPCAIFRDFDRDDRRGVDPGRADCARAEVDRLADSPGACGELALYAASIGWERLGQSAGGCEVSALLRRDRLEAIQSGHGGCTRNEFVVLSHRGKREVLLFCALRGSAVSSGCG